MRLGIDVGSVSYTHLVPKEEAKAIEDKKHYISIEG